ncbi:hypothetical protein BGZ68_002268 [Mortierella alpina]|nr:hypothetical protein BGZ68_002268 [Mortierella alpina]
MFTAHGANSPRNLNVPASIQITSPKHKNLANLIEMRGLFLLVAALCAPALVASDCRIRRSGQGVFSSPEAPSESALVTSTCLNRDFGSGIFPQPCNCPAGYTLYSNSDCGGQSEHYTFGGWITGQNNWPVRSYRCDDASVAIRCISRDFGYGIFSRPCECLSGYTVYGNSECGGQSYHKERDEGWTSDDQYALVKSYHYGCGAQAKHINDGGWMTDSTQWPVMSYKCDVAKIIPTECTNRQYSYGDFPKPAECAGTYTIYESAGCTGEMSQTGESGWTTRWGEWPVQSFRCDDDCKCTR